MNWVRLAECDTSACAEVAVDGEAVLLRSSLRPERIVSFERDEWAALCEAIRAGEFAAPEAL